MIRLTKLNNEEFIVNCNQIQSIEIIPESKVILMNKEFFVVKESADEIIDKVIEFNARIWDKHKLIKVETL
ncbi:flagellar FlbD family protein [Anaerovorax odorimutans]|uniref:flagellar FlbD family protein n=1 Tax=Anaerovorax odorimutans TaxID=109327 RepID=UPI00040EBA0D|nr:flagellar FlbD family protein [Anaerovorax odorimutans]